MACCPDPNGGEFKDQRPFGSLADTQPVPFPIGQLRCDVGHRADRLPGGAGPGHDHDRCAPERTTLGSGRLEENPRLGGERSNDLLVPPRLNSTEPPRFFHPIAENKVSQQRCERAALTARMPQRRFQACHTPSALPTWLNNTGAIALEPIVWQEKYECCVRHRRSRRLGTELYSTDDVRRVQRRSTGAKSARPKRQWKQSENSRGGDSFGEAQLCRVPRQCAPTNAQTSFPAAPPAGPSVIAKPTVSQVGALVGQDEWKVQQS